MRFPWNSKHHRHERVGVVDPDHLTGSSQPEPLTPVHRPDSIRLLRHFRPLELTSAVDWELEICQWIDVMAARGLLDDATYYVVDEMIRTRLAAELHLIDEEARSATSTERGLLLGNDQANLQRVQLEVARLRERDQELRVQIAENISELTGAAALLPRMDYAPSAVPVEVTSAPVRLLPAAPAVSPLGPFVPSDSLPDDEVPVVDVPVVDVPVVDVPDDEATGDEEEVDNDSRAA